MLIKEYFRTAFRKGGDIENYAYTAGLSKDELTSLYNAATYKRPIGQCQQFPVSLNFYKFSDDEYCVSRIVNSTFDIDNRTGNFFAHSIIISKEDLAGINNNMFLLLNEKGLFIENLTSFEKYFKEEKRNRLKPRDISISLNDDYAKVLNLKTIQASHDIKHHIISLINCLRSLDSVQKTIIVVADNDIKDRFMEALLLCLPTKNRCLVTFTTYIRKIGTKTENLYRVVFTMNMRESNSGFSREDYANNQIFNFVDNEFSDYPDNEIKYYARYITELVWEESIDGARKADRIRDFLETVPRFKGDLVEAYCSYKYYSHLYKKTNNKSKITEIINHLIKLVQVPEGDGIFFKNIYTFLLSNVISLVQLKNYITRICEYIDKRNDQPKRLEVLSSFYTGLVVSGVKERKDALYTIFESYKYSAAKYRKYFEDNDIRWIFLKYNLPDYYIQDIRNYLLSIVNEGNDFDKRVKKILTQDSLINSLLDASNKEVKLSSGQRSEIFLLIDLVKTISGFKSPSLDTFVDIRRKLINKRDQFDADSNLANLVKQIDKQIVKVIRYNFRPKYSFDIYNYVDKIKDDFDKSDPFVIDILLLKGVFRLNEKLLKGVAIEKRDLQFIHEQTKSVSGVSYIRFSKNIKKALNSINKREQEQQTIETFADTFLEGSDTDSTNKSILIDIISSFPVKEKHYCSAYLTHYIMTNYIDADAKTFVGIIQELIFHVDFYGCKRPYIKEVEKLMKDYVKKCDEVEPELFKIWENIVNPKKKKLSQKLRPIMKDLLVLKKVSKSKAKGNTIEKIDLRLIKKQISSISDVSSHIQFTNNIKQIINSIKNNREHLEQLIEILADVYLEDNNSNNINESTIIDIISSLPVQKKQYYFAYLTYCIMTRNLNVSMCEDIMQELMYQADIEGYRKLYIKEVKNLMKDYMKEYDEPKLFKVWDKFSNPKMSIFAQKWRQVVHGK